MMKKILSIMSIVLVVTMLGCAKESTDPQNEPATKFPPPSWKADETGKYPATMTAVISLPVLLAPTAMENDHLAAFIGDECRGVGVVVEVNSQNLFFVLIQGLPEESGKITFKYYSNKTSYMYESRSTLNFLVDVVYGTAVNPKTIELEQLK